MKSNKKDACVQFGVDESLIGDKVISNLPDEWKFLEPIEFSDIKMHVEDKVFYCHKIMLANYSPVFKAMLSGNFKEKSLDSITIKDVDPIGMELLLQALYVPNYKCQREKEAYLILPICEQYQIEHIKEEVQNCLVERCQLNSPSGSNQHRTSIDYLRLSVRYNLYRLRQTALDIVARPSNKELQKDLARDEELKDFQIDIYKNRVKTLEDMIKNIEMCLTMPCTRIERREIREPVNHCSAHTAPLTKDENNQFCIDCVNKLKIHIKNVCGTDKIRTTINYANANRSTSQTSILTSTANRPESLGTLNTSTNTGTPTTTSTGSSTFSTSTSINNGPLITTTSSSGSTITNVTRTPSIPIPNSTVVNESYNSENDNDSPSSSSSSITPQ